MASSHQHEPASVPERVGVRELRSNLTQFLRQVRQGRSFLVMSHDTVVAELRPPPHAEPFCRRPGALRGKIKMADDFDVLPPDLQAAMESNEV